MAVFTSGAALFVDSESFFKRVQKELKSYEKLVLFIENKIKEDAVDAMVNEYSHHMNHFNSRSKSNTEANASNSIKLIWKMHLLHPKIYREDCFKRFGRVITPEDRDLELNLLQSETTPTSTTETKQSRKFSGADLKKSLFLHYAFVQKILRIKENDVNIREWIADYKQFMTSIGKNTNNTTIGKNTNQRHKQI
eukprot:399074_1